ncbi:hypothetical protein KIN20_036142 [Parelaphostrongylus tenuis]|uniref:Uncharacterized protein n=1 Tax=Parelaphostrongylus tenuis TaxID=148309 RepID=A0AAD5WL01_PARTN|nr:hypothetical protein KIN20_036142 [Parelaphostrongylus tenuis]
MLEPKCLHTLLEVINKNGKTSEELFCDFAASRNIDSVRLWSYTCRASVMPAPRSVRNSTILVRRQTPDSIMDAGRRTQIVLREHLHHDMMEFIEKLSTQIFSAKRTSISFIFHRHLLCFQRQNYIAKR